MPGSVLAAKDGDSGLDDGDVSPQEDYSPPAPLVGEKAGSVVQREEGMKKTKGRWLAAPSTLLRKGELTRDERSVR